MIIIFSWTWRSVEFMFYGLFNGSLMVKQCIVIPQSVGSIPTSGAIFLEQLYEFKSGRATN